MEIDEMLNSTIQMLEKINIYINNHNDQLGEWEPGMVDKAVPQYNNLRKKVGTITDLTGEINKTFLNLEEGVRGHLLQKIYPDGYYGGGKKVGRQTKANATKKTSPKPKKK